MSQAFSFVLCLFFGVALSINDVDRNNRLRMADKEDATDVRWDHAVNSKQKLERALRGHSDMIEADVLFGTVDGQGPEIVPIMAHPPAKSSDLSLERFIDTIIESKTHKGIKLDFKELEVVEQALLMVGQRGPRVPVPLWLNADIVPGPVNATTKPLDAGQFLSLCKRFFPTSVISVGWTTRFGPDVTSSPVIITEGSYTFEHVRDLHDKLVKANITQEVTFPVRAGIAASAESRKNLIWLLRQVPFSTLTVWSSFYDTVDLNGLMKTIELVGRARVYIDVPDGLQCQIKHYYDRD